METRLGQAAPRVVAMEAILAACPLVAEVEAVAEGPCEGPWLLIMPRGSLSLRASPGGLLVPVGCLVCRALEGFPVIVSCPVCLALEVCRVLYCPVCLALEGSWYPLTSPWKFWGGGRRVPAVGAGPRGSRPRAPKTICHGLQSSQLRHGPQSSQLHHGLQSSLHRHGFQSSQLRHGPCLSVLLWRSPVLRSCLCLSWGASRAPTPPPWWNC